MRPGDEATLTLVTSRDGAQIGFFTSGDGPPLLLVHGGLGDHTHWEALLPYLEPHFTIHAMDRRGRGASGDGPDYAPQREFEDVAAVIDAVAADSGSRTDVYGFSSGATFALGAAALTQNVRRLALYEPGITAAAVVVTPELHARLDALLTAGDGDGLVETFFREAFGLGDDDIATMRAQPSWAAYVAAAPTLPRELRATPEQLFDASRAAKMNVPTLLLEGNEPLKNVLADVRTAADLRLVADTVPGARIAVLEGQAHAANVLAPELVAEHLLAFFGEPT